MKLDYQETRLANGLRVATSRMPHIESVALGVWAGVGGRYESRRSSGLSHFIEHLLFKGTRKRSARDISQAIEGRGGYFNAFTQEESTCFYARITSEYLWEVLDILADMYLHPRFDRQEIDKERGVIIEEIMMYRDQPQQHVQDMLGELLWQTHPLGRPLIGTPQNIRGVSRRDIARFKNRFYVPRNTLVTFAGQLDHEQCVAEVRRRFRAFSGKAPPRFKPASARVPQAPLAVQGRSVEQTHLAMGIRLFGRNDPRRYAMKLLSVILGENMSSRLFQVVREKYGLAYSVHSSLHLFADTGVLAITAGLDRKRAPRALRLILKELRRLREKKVGAAELRRAKDYAIGQLRIGLESTTTQMIWLGENNLGYDRFVQPDEIISRLERVTTEQIQRIAAAVIRRRRISLALITPEAQATREEDAARRELENAAF